MPTVSRGLCRGLFSGVAVFEDFADRLNHVWTFGLLLIFAGVISWRQQLFNNPIVCHTPSEFTDAKVAYAHATCWNSYYAAMPAKIPIDFVHFKLWNYKWIPVILVIQALLFKLPALVKYILHGYSGVSCEKIASLTEGYQNLNLIERAYLGKQTGRYLFNWCKKSEGFLPWKVLSITWLISKILFCINAVVQLSLLDKLLSTRNPPFDMSRSYGDTIYNNLFDKTSVEWTPSPIFPRTFLCEYSLRILARVDVYTVQCELTVSEFNEYAFMLIWIWLLLVAIISCLSLATWVVTALVPIVRERYINKMLELSEEIDYSKLGGHDLSVFRSMVGEDGVIALKLVASNSSEFMARDAVTTMFQMQMARRYPQTYQHPGQSPEGVPLLETGTGGVHSTAT